MRLFAALFLLLPGSALVVSTHRHANVLTIPSAALGARAGDGSYSVQVRGADGRAVARRIAIGLDDQIQVEVRSGLKQGEQVVLAQAGDEDAAAPAQPR